MIIEISDNCKLSVANVQFAIEVSFPMTGSRALALDITEEVKHLRFVNPGVWKTADGYWVNRTDVVFYWETVMERRESISALCVPEFQRKLCYRKKENVPTKGACQLLAPG